VVTCDNDDEDTQYVRSPCLIIEVLSPSTEAIDRGAKFAKYRQFLALKEYVLVNTSEPKVEMFRRNDQGQWVLSEYDLEDKLHLESIDVEIAIADLYRQVKFELE
jgi:Uma2 family endonuclease